MTPEREQEYERDKKKTWLIGTMQGLIQSHINGMKITKANIESINVLFKDLGYFQGIDTSSMKE